MQSSPLENESEEQTIGDATVECLQGDIYMAKEIIRECNAWWLASNDAYRGKGKDSCGVYPVASIETALPRASLEWCARLESNQRPSA
jgi:hypothetical protein